MRIRRSGISISSISTRLIQTRGSKQVLASASQNTKLFGRDMSTKVHSNAFWSTNKSSDDTPGPRLAVLLLNASNASWIIPQEDTPDSPAGLFWSLWTRAELTICADGGANRLFDRSKEIGVLEKGAPHYIKGDLDSLRDDVRKHYSARNTSIIHDRDQDSNDLGKCLELIQEEQRKGDNSQKFSVMIFGAMGGRFDQEMQNINALYCWKDTFEQITLLSEQTTAVLLEPDVTHTIRPNFNFESRTCGLIPVGEPCTSLTTSGLKWNLKSGATAFGGLVSSSNRVDDSGNEVQVHASHPLIWTTELREE